MRRVRVGERVVHGVPVAELVRRVEVHRATRGRVGDRRRELAERGALAQRVEHCAQRGPRLLVEDFFRQRPMGVPVRAALAARGKRSVELLVGLGEQPRQVDRVPPARGLLHPLRLREHRHEARQDRARVLPADVVDELEGLVREVEGVPDVEEDVVRAGREDHLAELLRRQPDRDRGAQRPLRRLLRACLDEAPEPGAVHLGAPLLRLERIEVEVRWLPGRRARDVHEPLVERAWPVRRRQQRQHVRHRREDREPAAPACRPVAGAEERRALEQRRRRAELVETDHRLRDHQPQVLLESLVELAQPVAAPVGLDRSGVEPDLAVAQLHAEGGHVVREGIEGRAPCEVEARVVPVTGQDAVAHGPAAEREAHVRAAVVERVHAPLDDVDDDRAAARRDHARLVGLELLERADVDQPGWRLGRCHRDSQPTQRV